MNIHNNPYDIYEPTAGHKERFKRKITMRLRPKRRFIIKPEWIAASVLILMGIVLLNDNFQKQLLASLSSREIYPRMVEKQEQWASFIKQQVLEWEHFETPEAKRLIKETYEQLNRLDADYQKLSREFQQTGNRFVLDAMIENTKQRNELLEELQKKLIKIEKMKRYEKQKHSL